MIFTFYSYKGGVGRSMALANVAELFYRQGLKVLLVDWDLEAPGLERFFPNRVQQVLESPGIIDMLITYKRKAQLFDPASGEELYPVDEIQNYLIDMYPDEDTYGKLWLIPAGYRAENGFAEYVKQIRGFDWQDFYQNWEGEIYFEWLREQFETLADIVLIDSRTGVTEMGGVCTYQFADIVVLLCAASEQNIDGTLRMLKSFSDPRLTQLRYNRRLRTLVVPSRIERTAEVTSLNNFRQKFITYFEPYLPDEFRDEPDFYIQLEIPYIPFYAFEESIAVNQTETEKRSIEMENAYYKLFDVISKIIGSTTNDYPQTLNSISVIDKESPFGTTHPDSIFYIERTADRDCLKYLTGSYAVTLFVNAPMQMGKSSLMRRVLHQIKRAQQYAYIDFQKFTEQYLADEENFFIQLCLMIGEALGISEAIDHYWTGRRTNIVKCSRYMTQHVIPRVNGPFILALDEVERMQNCSFRTNFFGMLRTWHNDRVDNEYLAKMSLFLSSSTDPYLLIDNPNQSPFNVAIPISLQDFTLGEVHELNRRHNSPLNIAQINDLMDLLEGHPFLTRLALYLLVLDKINLSTLLAQATADEGPFGEHLRHYLRRVLRKPELKQALTLVSQNRALAEDEVFHRLREAGLIKKSGQEVIFRNKLYERYFKERLNG